MKKPVVLIVLDGWGYREEKEFNPIANAHLPCFNNLWNKYPHNLLEASGSAVGLSEGQMGNSEVGHMTIGAGRILDTDLVRISKFAERDEFEKNEAFQKLFQHIKQYNSVLHVEGLIGPGGVHSHSDHLFAFLRAAKKCGIKKIAVHAFLDGRDTPPQSAIKHLQEVEKVIGELGIGFIATVTGRFYAMDRDKNWDRIAKAEQAIFYGIGHESVVKPSELMIQLYKQGIVDEHVEPVVFLEESGKPITVQKNDGVMFFNFRSDRAKQTSKKILAKKNDLNLCFVTMTEYEKDLGSLVAFPPERTETTLAAEISGAGLTQAHIAETEKFAHATFFLNCGRENPHLGEEFVLIDSRKDIKTHDEAPEMRAAEIADKAIEKINNGVDFIFINFANPDMVGHTANHEAIIKAIEAVDKALDKVLKVLEKIGGVAIITADHGNAEFSFDKFTQTKHTAHTTNPVPVIGFGFDRDLRPGSLRDVAPTILEIFNLDKPKTMTGKSLFD